MKCWIWLFSTAALYGQMAEGNIVDGISGGPVVGATVRLATAGNWEAPSARSDLGGHFQLSIPPPESESQMLVVSRTGYLAVSRGLPAPSSAERMSMRITLAPQAVITGRIEDEDGFGVSQGFVEALTYLVAGDRKVMQTAGGSAFNEPGEYRISGLPAGRYYIRVWNFWQLNEWDLRYAPEFYGGTLTPEGARMVEVKAGDIREGIDLHLKRRQGARITARVSAPGSWGKADVVDAWLGSEFGFSRKATVQDDGAQVHRTLLSAGVWILEGLDLSRVRPGRYELLCLPLKIFKGDGSPARAILTQRRK